MDACLPDTGDRALMDAFWSATAKAWLHAMRARLGSSFAVSESDRFLLLTALDERAARRMLEYLEKTRKRILRVLEGIATESELGKLCVLVFANEDEYYRYVSEYGTEEGELARSAGMFLQYGYGHFVFVQDHMSAVEPTIAHELTHCMLQHLPLPAWLNEGIAVKTEYRLSPPQGRPLYTPEEMRQRHLEYWNERTIQEFWSGKSWRRPGESNTLSYDLAVHFVGLASREFAAFREFANAASVDDSGDTAARAHLGFPLARFAQAVLGEGRWQPDPAKWGEGTELGQFSDDAL